MFFKKVGSVVQSFVNLVYRYPRSSWDRMVKLGGVRVYIRMMRMQGRMKKAAYQLEAVTSYPDGLVIYFLTGKKFLYQTLFCIKSLAQHTSERFKFHLVDDGSFDPAMIAQIKHQLPGAEIILNDSIERHLDLVLPRDRYPVIRDRRGNYPHLKKLTDIHTLPGDDWKVVLDSDMLFVDEPRELLRWLNQPDQPIHMIDCMESYGYDRTLMEGLAGNAIAPLVNVGLIGLKSRSINWDLVEVWIKQLEDAGGKTYYLEQALTAMLLAGETCVALNPDEYIVNPSPVQIISGTGILHHYVASSKKGYFIDAWNKKP